MPLRPPKASIGSLGERPSWWRKLSLKGVGLLLLGAVATGAFVIGIVTGETILLPSYKAKSGGLEVSLSAHPFFFYVAMAINFMIAAVIWWLLIAWLRERRTKGQSPLFSKLSAAPRAATRYDPKSGVRARPLPKGTPSETVGSRGQGHE